MARSTTAASSKRTTGTVLRILLVILAICRAWPVEAAQPPACYHVVNVDLWDVLYIRSKKSHLSRAVGAIAPDHTGVLRATGQCDPPGGNRKRQWCPVDYYPLPTVRISGYVKAYFIEPSACPRG